MENWTTEDENAVIQTACKNVIGPDGEFRCPSIARAGLSADSCFQSFTQLRASATDDQRLAFRIVIAGLAISASCEEVDAVFQLAAGAAQTRKASLAAVVDPPGGCKRRPDASYDLSGEDMLRRRGLGDRLFSDTRHTADTPIEVCGVRGELEWLTRLTCNDGSRPWGHDVTKAHSARLGSQVSKSRCDGEPVAVDHYVVPCPEKQYDVYLDMYECGPGERM